MHFNKSKAQLFNNLSDLKQAIDDQKVDVVGLNSVDYLNIRNQVQLEPALVTVFGNDYGNKYVLLVHKESNVRNLNQLKTKKILLHSGSTPIPLLWLRNLLKKQGLPREDRFFGSYKEVDKPSQAILPVFFRQADACIVTRRAFETSAELNPQISQKLEPLITSPLFVDSVLLFHKIYKSNNKKIFMDTAINIKKYPMAKQVMTLFQIDGFALFSESYLYNVITLMQESGKLN
jgi:ABC-type phosphate/phosphonate transport system substrate-binding protein